jgi:hypothetical protein
VRRGPILQARSCIEFPAFQPEIVRTVSVKLNPKTFKEHIVELFLHTMPPLAAIGYSLVYLLGGGGLVGAFVIFLVAKMLGD